jgi:hypothetical protein
MSVMSVRVFISKRVVYASIYSWHCRRSNTCASRRNWTHGKSDLLRNARQLLVVDI